MILLVVSICKVTGNNVKPRECKGIRALKMLNIFTIRVIFPVNQF